MVMPEITLEQAISDEDLGERVERETPVTETEELDYKAEYERLTAELEAEREARQKQERDERARNIQLLSQKQKDEVLLKIAEHNEAILARLDSGEITKAEASKAISQGVERIQAEVEMSASQQTLGATMVETERQYKKDGLVIGPDGALLDPGIGDHFVSFWNQAATAFRAGKFEAADAWYRAAVAEMERVTEQLKDGKPGRRSDGLSLNAGGRVGAAAGMSDQSWLDRYSDEENGGIPSTPENTQRAKALRAKGLRPRPLKI